MERWVLLRKGADFEAISKKFHISPRLASLIRNRDVIGDEAINQYLNGTIAELYDGMQMKGMPQAVEILTEKIRDREKIRVIGDKIEITRKGSFIYFDFHGTGFLQNMVRILVGTLLEVGKGKIKPEQIPEILEAKNRQMAGPTAPAQGLCLIKVDY